MQSHERHIPAHSPIVVVHAFTDRESVDGSVRNVIT